jgi:hypothetical protein
MICPHCHKEFANPVAVAGGKASRRKAGPRCQVHGIFLGPDGKCSKCTTATVLADPPADDLQT